jgi:HEAT repeat protein
VADPSSIFVKLIDHSIWTDTVNHIRQSMSAIVVLLAAVATAAAGEWQLDDGRPPSPKTERELLAVLHSNAPKAEKAFTCKYLAIYGTSKAVPALAPLLNDPQLASWARIALEAISGREADEALEKSLGTLQGKLLVGAINSVAVRRDANAVGALSGRLRDENPDVASAAAVALGHIANADALRLLRQSLAAAPPKVRSAVAEGLVLCADRLMADGHTEEAAGIYDQVRNAAVARQRLVEATRGAILARRDGGIPLLLEQLHSTDKGRFRLALTTVREMPGRRIDEALAAELDHTAADRAALLIPAMADRKDTVVLPAVVKAAGKGPREVRLAAVDALGRVGDSSCLSTLLGIALEKDADLTEAAKAALAVLPGQNVDRDVVASLHSAKGKMYPLLLEVVGSRRISAVPDLVKALDNPDSAVRTAALTSLGQTVPFNKLAVLISQVVAPKNEEDVPVAERALKSACIRMPDREACAKGLAAAMNGTSDPTKIALLKILGAVGGSTSLATIGAAAKGSNAALFDASTKLLGNWMTIDAAPVLLDVAKTGPSEKYRVRALHGYIRIARQFTMEDDERLAMCRNALAAAKQPAEGKLVLDVLERYPSIDSLKEAAKSTRDSKLKKEAASATLAIARKLDEKGLNGKSADVQSILSGAKLDPVKVKVEIVKAEYGAGKKQKDVTKTLQKVIKGLPLILLPSSYVAAFGDPVPGTPKKLKIDYRLDGKKGEATFAENALIILPTPK